MVTQQIEQLPPKESWLSPKIAIKDSPLGGKGMFAIAPIDAGEELVVWGGFYTSDADKVQEARQMGRFAVQWDDELFSIEGRSEDPAFFINHRCEPNTWMKNAFTLEASRVIAVGEEITADYAVWEGNPAYVSKWQCNCGVKTCRGRVTGHDWERPELQTRYKGHFSPFLNKKIAALHNK